MKINSILKYLLKKIFPAIIFFIVKNYFGLDLNDFNPFISETKEFFNGNNSQGSSINPPSEGEGSNRQNNNDNNNTPNLSPIINLPFSSDMSEEKLEEIKALYIKNIEEGGVVSEEELE
jgi:hypothetical protein